MYNIALVLHALQDPFWSILSVRQKIQQYNNHVNSVVNVKLNRRSNT